jgi:hypothetical protein
VPNHIEGVTFRFGENGAVEEAWSSAGDGIHITLFY